MTVEVNMVSNPLLSGIYVSSYLTLNDCLRGGAFILEMSNPQFEPTRPAHTGSKY